MYFAFQSNVLIERLRHQTPSCRPHSVANLSGYSLNFHKKLIDGSAKCKALQSQKASDVIVDAFYEICSTETAV